MRQLNEVDPDSASRFAFKKSGEPSIDKDKFPYFNIGVLADHMERLTNYLFGLGEMFNDAIHFKCEMEDESQAEDRECRE